MSWHLSGPPILEGEDERELKLAFARYCFDNPGLKTKPDTTCSPDARISDVRCKRKFGSRSVVRAELEALRGDEDEVDDRFRRSRKSRNKAWDMANDPAADHKDRVAALRLCAEVEGAIQKGPAIVNDNRTINVLRVPTRDVGTRRKTTPTLTKVQSAANEACRVADARSARPVALLAADPDAEHNIGWEYLKGTSQEFALRTNADHILSRHARSGEDGLPAYALRRKTSASVTVRFGAA
jgi:hypothetical protein